MFGRPDLLAERLLDRDSRLGIGTSTQMRPHRKLVEALVDAATGGGLLARGPELTSRDLDHLNKGTGWNDFIRQPEGGVRLIPCPHCGGHRRSPLNVTAVDGLVCLDCRRDSSGVRWPAEDYDRWIPSPGLWLDVGWTPMPPAPIEPGAHAELMAGFRSNRGGRPRGPHTLAAAPGHRLASDLSSDEAAAAVLRYLAGEERVADIRASLCLEDNEWRKLLRTNGSPRRSKAASTSPQR